MLRFFTTVSSLKIYQAEIKEFNLEIEKQASVLELFGEIVTNWWEPSEVTKRNLRKLWSFLGLYS